MMRRAASFALGVLLGGGYAHAGTPAVHDSLTRTQPPRIIARIAIETGDVIPPWSYEAQTASNPAVQWLYRVVNWSHIKTKPEIVERELLFAVGDTLDPLKLDESERILRAYPFINEAEITVPPLGPGEVEVNARTSDNYSLAPGLIFESGGGTSEYGLLLIEKNLFGLGKEVAGQYVLERNSTRNSTESSYLLQYKDPRLFRSHFALNSFLSHETLGDEVSLSVARPFYSVRTRLAGGADLDWFEGHLRLWRNEFPVAELPVHSLVSRAWMARAWGDPFRRIKLSGNVTYADIKYPDPPLVSAGWLPRDTLRTARRSLEPTLALGREVTREFRKMQDLDDYGVVEDVEIGWNAGVSAGFGFPSRPTDAAYGVAGASGQWSDVRGAHVTVVRGEAFLRVCDDIGAGRRTWSNLRTSAFLHHYYQGLPRQTLALNVGWRGGWRMDPPYQLVLGGDVGLRGYHSNRFEGTRRVLINAEDRIFTPWRILTYAFGFVAFADAGYVWTQERPVRPQDLRADVGFGLRIYNTRAATARVSRLDIAFNLRGERGFLLALGSEQLFDLFNKRPTPTR